MCVCVIVCVCVSLCFHGTSGNFQYDLNEITHSDRLLCACSVYKYLPSDSVESSI